MGIRGPLTGLACRAVASAAPCWNPDCGKYDGGGAYHVAGIRTPRREPTRVALLGHPTEDRVFDMSARP